MPAKAIASRMKLNTLDAGLTEVIWRSVATDVQVLSYELGARIEAFYRRSLENLDRLLRQA